MHRSIGLRRRIFSWLLGSLLLTAALVAAVTWIAGDLRATPWNRQREGAQALIARQLGNVWGDPAARDALAADIAQQLDVAIQLEDSTHRPIATFGQPYGRAWMGAPVMRGAQTVGAYELFGDTHSHRAGWPFLLAIAVAFFGLWAAAGRVSRRLSRPIDELAHVAEQLGDGRLDSRAHLPCRAPGEIRILGHALNDMAARIAQQLADHRELLAGVSHELRTPLARIRLLTELGRGTPDPKTLDEIDREIVEMDALVDQLLVSSRLDFQTLAKRPLQVQALASRALERAGHPAEQLSATGVESLEVDGDATLLGRALANLIDNAQRHAGGLERLLVDRVDGAVRFAAEDRGPGFADGEAARAFAPFFRGERGENGSLGLGLSLVRRIAEAHGGAVFAENRAGGGARVGFSLPLRS